jgi:ribonucleoside-diphosphate reductase beta chain
MSITKYREIFKPSNGFEHPEYFQIFEKALSSVWDYKEVVMGQDVIDYHNSTDNEKRIISGILRGFTQIECVIGDYWSTFVAQAFPKPEIVAACRAFAFFEVIHSAAYNHLSSTLGIDEEVAYIGDKYAQQKIHFLLSDNSTSIKTKLAIFSGAAEGVALFSSFSILLSFANRGKFKGLSQIISWSITDENNHSDCGISLFKELARETPLTAKETSEIILGFKNVLKNEFAFLDNIFVGIKEINGISYESFKSYILSRANDRLLKLGINHGFDYDESLADNVSSWFMPLVSGSISNDFFTHHKEGAVYNSKPTFNFEKINWETITNGIVRP